MTSGHNVEKVFLTPHPETPGPDIRVAVSVDRPRRQSLLLEYEITGDVAGLRVPGWVRWSRADELWRTTCFEAFVARPEGGYLEFNQSPSGQWAVYAFDGYRAGMAHQPGVEITNRLREQDEDRLFVSAQLDLDRMNLGDGPWRLGLSTVIEDLNGRISYWALNHPPGKPDFHHPDSFVLDLP